MKKTALLLAVLLAGTAAAQDYRRDWAEQWPLSLSSEQSGAYRVVLDARIYQRAVSPQLSDVQAYNAAGQALPSALLQPEQPLAQPPVQRELPWFALPALDARSQDNLQVVAERDADGRVRQVQARLSAAAPAPGAGWLIDASALGDAPIAALVLDWAAPSAPLQAAVRVDGSDDLRQWHSMGEPAALVDLQRGDRRLLQRRLALQGSARYLRVLPQDGQRLPTLRMALAELTPAPATLVWEWETPTAVSGGDGSFEFELHGRFPVRQLDVDTDGNSLVQWTAFSRDDADAPWQRRAAPWVAYQVQQAGGRSRSAPRALNGVVRDRYWKLVADPAATAPTPVLRLGYRSEVLVFVSQGAAPYALAVGSATAKRVDAPVQVLVDDLRMRNAPGWQPSLARLESAAEPLAGEAALTPARDWKQALLWVLLGVGVLGVAGLALSVLRQKPPG